MLEQDVEQRRVLGGCQLGQRRDRAALREVHGVGVGRGRRGHLGELRELREERRRRGIIRKTRGAGHATRNDFFRDLRSSWILAGFLLDSPWILAGFFLDSSWFSSSEFFLWAPLTKGGLYPR